MLQDVSDFLIHPVLDGTSISYYYEGKDIHTDRLIQLPRTKLSEEVAKGLMRQLAKQEIHDCKMYGVLLVETSNSETKVLKGFSGLGELSGWVPNLVKKVEIKLAEKKTLTLLDNLKKELLVLEYPQQRAQYIALTEHYQEQITKLNLLHAQNKKQRAHNRLELSSQLSGESLKIALERLDEDSRQEGIAKKRLKQQRDQSLQELKTLFIEADKQITQIKQKRKLLSRQLQAQLFQAYSLSNFRQETFSLDQLMIDGQLPTGTGECCGTKLLHYAFGHQLRPIAMAEFWWGKPQGDKKQGQFYGACQKRCQPIMGFLLSGLTSPKIKLPIIYQDEWLIVVNKPTGLLSVPGRYSEKQDSVESRLRLDYGEEQFLKAVHRLDQDTSGLIILALNKSTYCHLLKQFSLKQINKVYEAILEGLLKEDKGIIKLPLWGDPHNRPYQKVDWKLGKASMTSYQVISRNDKHTRIELIPLTGRTHQLRIHTAQGLGVPILGDPLYGSSPKPERLFLHAKKVSFEHPNQPGEYLHLESCTPF